MPGPPVLPPQPVGPGVGTPPSPNTVGQVITNALYEINVVAPGEAPEALEMAFALSKFCQLADSWNTQQYFIYAYDLLGASAGGPQYLLVPGLINHTIGPNTAGFAAPTFLVSTERPVRIASLNVILNNVQPVVRFPLTSRDKDWWSKQRVQTIQTALPTDFYYRPDWPLGSIFLWPVPNIAYQCEIEIETVLQGATQLNQAFLIPPGGELAFTLSLAELLSIAFEKPISTALLASASKARMNFMGTNVRPPRINLDDFGAPSSERPRASFNYHTGLDR